MIGFAEVKGFVAAVAFTGFCISKLKHWLQ